MKLFTENLELLDYAADKKKAIENQPMPIDILLKDIELCPSHTMKIFGKFAKITERAYDSFLTNVLDIPVNFVNKFRKITDSATETAMLSVLKDSLYLKARSKVTMLLNKRSEEVTYFVKNNSGYISNQLLYDVYEIAMNKYSSLKYAGFNYNIDGSIVLSSRCNEVYSYAVGEEFHGGLQFNNSPIYGGQVGDDVLRLVCWNGMESGNRGISINGTQASISKMFSILDGIEQYSFCSAPFRQNIARAMKANASVHELNYAFSTIKKYSAIDDDAALHYLGFPDCRKWLAKKGLEMASLSDGQMKNCPTNINMWDLINKITYFGSHEMGYGVDKFAISKNAGKLFAKSQYDEKNFIILN